MLLKWLFTILAILWLIQALQPYLGARKTPSQPPPAPPGKGQDTKEEGEYIDYEEIE